jgi:hypothetical protein
MPAINTVEITTGRDAQQVNGAREPLKTYFKAVTSGSTPVAGSHLAYSVSFDQEC